MRRPESDERGSISPLILGCALLVLILIAVVVDVSAVFVRRQSLANLADGAALSAADSGARAVQYTGVGDRLSQAQAAAKRGVQEYLAASGAWGQYPGLRAVTSVTDGGQTVRVRLSAPIDLPLHFPGAPMRTSVSADGAAVVQIRQ